MFGIMKRRFVSQVQAVVAECYAQASEGKTSFDGLSLCKPEFLSRLAGWMEAEEALLNAQQNTTMAEVGNAVIRAQVWVGIYLYEGAIARGAMSVPVPILKKFYGPAQYVSDDYFNKVRANSDMPFSNALRGTLEEALTRA